MENRQITSPEAPVVVGSRKMQRWVTFGEETTFHGFQHISSSTSRCRLCFWTCVLLAFFGILTYQVITLATSFLSYPTMTSVEMQYPADGMQLPNFTVCTLVRGKRSALLEKFPKIDISLANFLAASFLSVYSTTIYDMGYLPYKYNQTAEDLRDRLIRVVDESNGTLTPKLFFEEISFPCPEIFIEPGCWYQNAEIFECCKINTMFLSHNGPCYTFDMSDKKQFLPGPVGGFGFKYWHPNDSEMVPFLFNSYMERAIHVFTSPEDAVLNRNGLAIQPGIQILTPHTYYCYVPSYFHTHDVLDLFKAHVTLEGTRYQRIRRSHFYPRCYIDKNLLFFPDSLDYNYHRCQLDCVMQEIVSRCSCTGLNTFVLNSTLTLTTDNITQMFCSPYQGLICFRDYVLEFPNITQMCRTSRCPVSCAAWDFKATASIGKAFHSSMEEETAWYLQSTRTSGLKDSLIVADFYYSDICHIQISEVPMFSIETFVSNLGGALGLWCGASVITLVHLVFFMVNSICYGQSENESDHDVHVTKNGISRRYDAFVERSEIVPLNREPGELA